MADKDYLKKQIELISPDVIVTGNIGVYLNIIFGEGTINSHSERWYHNTIINNKPTIAITAYHPAKRGANYNKEFNNIVNGYQLALKDIRNKE